MTAKTTESQAISHMLTERWEQVNAKLADLAREFPEEKYETAPFAGIRTFGDVVRHVAFWNQYVTDTAQGRQADGSANELPKTKYATKACMIEALTKSSADAAAALRQHKPALDAEKAALVESFIEHVCEHYGQLVVYTRWVGIVPPASRA